MSPDEKERERPKIEEERHQRRSTPLPIVGIGASAGGLEAVSELLRHLPPDTGMAFVLIQHLDPQHASVLTEILSKTTSIKVSEVTHGMKVGPDQAYVIPPNANMVIRGGVLELTPRPETRGQNMPIDGFLRSLAKDRGPQAIAVILSGTGSDGTVGISEVKAEGGIAFAQDETAKYDGMPRSAIATGHVDFVLPPRRIAGELVRISAHPYLSQRPIQKDEEVPGEVQDDLAKILDLLRRAKGVDFSLYKQGTLNRRISRRLALHKLRSLEEYVGLLRESASEVEALFQDLLIHVTGFFRDPDAFEALKAVVFPALMANRSPDDELRIWVPGCSTGEEAYSIAISLFEFLGDKAGGTSAKIFATDISDQAIETARAGIYGESISGDVSPERLRRFFVNVERGYEVNKTIRETCIFAKQDVTKDPPFSNLDLISCRNVLIYFGPVLHKKILPVFHYSLKPTGFLMLGSSEAVGQFADLFRLKEKKHRIYSKKPTTTSRVFDFPVDDRSTVAALGGDKKGEPPPGRLDLNREIDRFLLGKYSPPAVVIDQDLKIVQVRGETGPYLQLAPGTMSANVLKMATQGLQLGLRGAIETAKKSRGSVVEQGLRVKSNDHDEELNLHVVPLEDHESGGEYLLVVFERATPSTQPESRGAERRRGSWLTSVLRPGRGRAPFRPEASTAGTESGRIARLRKELDETKRYLQSLVQEQEAANEELRAANEETLSANEELLSTNEELETAKEELQATNEELGTVNEELQNRNLEASRLNDDLNNLLGSTDIPIIMLGSDRSIRRFTPTAAKALNLIPSDVGRPIGDLKPKINVPDLEAVIEEVVEDFIAREREVQDQEGHWYRMHIRPYRTLDKRVEGSVIALLDIHQLKVMEHALRQEGELTGDKLLHSEATNRSIVENAAVGIVTLTKNGLIDTFNPTAERLFGYTAREVLGKDFKTLVPPPHPEEPDGYLADCSTTGEKKTISGGREVEGLRKDGTTFSMDLLLSEIRDGERGGFTAVLHDITERKQAERSLRRLSQVFMDSADPILILDLSGQITDLNAEAERAYGGTRQELVGQPLKTVVPPERHEEVRELLGRCRRGELVRNVEGLRSRKSGEVYPILFTLSLLTDGAGKGIGIANVAKDITELKRSEERLLQSARLAAVGEAMTGLAHEGRNALQQSQASLEMLARRISDRPEALDLIADIQKYQDELHGLYEEVRQYAAPLNLNRDLCDLKEVVEEVWRESRATDGRKAAQLHQEGRGLDLRCKLDRALFRRVVRNILDNSLAAKDDDVRVDVCYREVAVSDKPGIRIEICDNGPGLTDEGREKIFDAFYTTKTEGTGLGMAIAKRIVEAHGGHIEVGHQDRREAEIVITLPREIP